MTTNAKSLVSETVIDVMAEKLYCNAGKAWDRDNLRDVAEAIAPMLAQAGDAVSEPVACKCGALCQDNGDVCRYTTPPHDDAKVARDAEELQRLRALVNSPELHDFAKGVVLEAGHQRERWGNDHDAGKEPADWFWLLGYLSGKALAAHQAGNIDKALHHTISSAAALANWHGAILESIRNQSNITAPHIRGSLS